MKVQLLQTVPSIGKSGQIVEVSDAQARNQLFPKKLAVAATGAVLASFENQQKQTEQKRKLLQQRIETIVSTLSTAAISLQGKASPQGKLFAAIKSSDIQRAVEALVGDKLPNLTMKPDHLKTLGQHPIEVTIDGHHTFTLNVNITHGK